jgi:hypothetical protein
MTDNLIGFESGDPEKSFTFELSNEACNYLTNSCEHGGLLTISTNGKRKRRPEERDYLLLKAGIPLTNVRLFDNFNRLVIFVFLYLDCRRRKPLQPVA